MEACLETELPPASELEESLRTGVILCKLGHWMEPEVLPLRRIYDLDGAKFQVLLREGEREERIFGRERESAVTNIIICTCISSCSVTKDMCTYVLIVD